MVRNSSTFAVRITKELLGPINPRFLHQNQVDTLPDFFFAVFLTAKTNQALKSKSKIR